MKLWTILWSTVFLWFAARCAVLHGESKRFAYALALLISLGIGIVLTKLSGTNEMGIPLVPIYGFMAGMGLGFTAVLTLPFKTLRGFSTTMLVGAWMLFWLSEAVVIAVLLI